MRFATISVISIISAAMIFASETSRANRKTIRARVFHLIFMPTSPKPSFYVLHRVEESKQTHVNSIVGSGFLWILKLPVSAWGTLGHSSGARPFTYLTSAVI